MERNIEENLDLIVRLRKTLHSIPEKSMHEVQTKQTLMDFIGKYTHTLEIVDRGVWFYVAKRRSVRTDDATIGVTESDAAKQGDVDFDDADALKPGETDQEPIAFRADMDALTCTDGQPRHLCGHDGHSAILAGLALWLDNADFKRDVYLIFQPGEETGEGGAICSALIDEKNIGEIYGIHNIPGYEAGTMLLLKETFACASTGLEIRFTGMQTHAAYPETGVNPASAIARVIQCMDTAIHEKHRGIVLGTVIGIEAGSRSYGVSAGEGTLRLTLRAQYQDEYDAFVAGIEDVTVKAAKDSGLMVNISRIEEFPATINHRECVLKVRDAARSLGMSCEYPEEPFRWSEDFGYYLQKTRGAFIGVGCGKSYPALHTMEYEFEDGIIGAVIELYKRIIDQKQE
jgi:amidohydrolase